MRIMTLLFIALLAGCDRGDLGKADDLFLCDPKTNNGYWVERNVGQTSFVWPIEKKFPSAVDFCKEQEAK